MNAAKFFTLFLLMAAMDASAAEPRGPGDLGGGDALKDEAASVNDVAEAVKKSHGSVMLVLNKLDREANAIRIGKPNLVSDEYGNEDKQKLNLLQKIFGQRESILGYARGARIEVLTKDVCKDAEGQPVPASVHSDIPSAICVSAWQLSQKLKKRNVEVEIAALIIHELSHKVGANEEEAQYLQGLAAHALLNAGNLTFGWRSDMEEKISGLRNFPEAEGICERGREVIGFWETFEKDTVQVGEISYLDGEDASLIFAEEWRLQALTDFLCSHDPDYSDSKRKKFADKFLLGMGEFGATSPGDYFERANNTQVAWFTKLAPIEIHKMNQLEEAGGLVREISANYNKLLKTGVFAKTLLSKFEVVVK